MRACVAQAGSVSAVNVTWKTTWGSHVQPTRGFELHLLPGLCWIYEAVQPDEQGIL